MAERQTERRSIWRVGPDSTWTTIVPVVFIIASLLTLVLLPIFFGRHTSQMRREITEVAEPSRSAANEIQTDLSTELGQIIAWQATGQPQYRREYMRVLERAASGRRETAAARAEAWARGRERSFDALNKESNEWHADIVANEFLSRQIPAEVCVGAAVRKASVARGGAEGVGGTGSLDPGSDR